jgi:hypothetical protein
VADQGRLPVGRGAEEATKYRHGAHQNSEPLPIGASVCHHVYVAVRVVVHVQGEGAGTGGGAPAIAGSRTRRSRPPNRSHYWSATLTDVQLGGHG